MQQWERLELLVLIQRKQKGWVDAYKELFLSRADLDGRLPLAVSDTGICFHLVRAKGVCVDTSGPMNFSLYCFLIAFLSNQITL